MKIDKEKTTKLVKEARQTKGKTQQELADLAGVSLRSIQRIENGEVLARSYTLGVLAKTLDFETSQAYSTEANDLKPFDSRLNKPRRAIISVAVVVVVILGSIAFASQTERFPETSFEAFTFTAGMSVVIAVVLYKIWK